MRPFTMHGDELKLGLADVDEELRDAVERLGFTRMGALYLKSFPGDAPHAAAAAMRFEIVAEQMVRQAAGLEHGRVRSAIELVRERAQGIDWTVADTAGASVDVVGDAARLADALADLLVEPLADGRCRAFDQARIEVRNA